MTRSQRLAGAAMVLAGCLGAPRLLPAQERGAVALGEAVAGLDVTPRVLLIGAHPDDEDTQLITWLARGRQVETAYLSLTRGDGGQNLIGNELGPLLGVIRTEELLAARRLDGGRQFFTRAYDFGFSKTAEETLRHWPRDSILRDVVTVVRAFRPHVIVAVFSGTPRDGHGHHQVSGLLARAAFDAAMDTVAWPRDRTDGRGPWRPLKLYRASRFFPGEATLRFNVGESSPLRGQSYAELASLSRSQHLSQGFGVVQRRGVALDHLRLEQSRVGSVSAAERSPLDGIDSGWSRFAHVDAGAAAHRALDSLPAAIAAVRAVENLTAPAPMVAPLARVARLMRTARDSLRCRGEPPRDDPRGCSAAASDLWQSLGTGLARATTALLSAASVTVEATAPRELVAVGDTLPVSVTVYNQGAAPIGITGAWVEVRGSTPVGAAMTVTVPPDSAQSITVPVVPRVTSERWWLTLGRRGDVFALPHGNGYIGTSEERIHDSEARAEITIAGVSVPVDAGPIVYRFADPARGELRRPIAAVPPIDLRLDDEVEYARAGVPLQRTYLVHVRSSTPQARPVVVTLQVPAGVSVDSAVRTLTLAPFGRATLRFRVRGALPAGRTQLRATAESAGAVFTDGWLTIEYPHIRPLRYYRPASVQLEVVPAALPRNREVAYIQGVGDNVASMLAQLGLTVRLVPADSLASADLTHVGAVVVGPRAFAASPALLAQGSRLQSFARAGGTVVVQYGQTEMQTPGLLPYPITLARPAERVTDEDAPVQLLPGSRKWLAAPNHIGESDFSGWVQERAVYMPTTADVRWQRVLETHDPGEMPNENALLVAPLGKGAYVYTTLALFRQLPAGVPGAARIFLDLLAAGESSAGVSRGRP